MACMKLGSKADGFQRRGQAWFCTTGLPSDIIIEVEEMTFHLHKFPLMSRSGLLTRLVGETPENAGDESTTRIVLGEIPGGAEAFELAAKFCYAVKVELTSANAVALRCAAEHLEMSEEFVEGNLIAKIDTFLNQVVLRSWKDSVRALHSCEPSILPHAEELGIVKKLIDSISSKACTTDPALFGWPVLESQQPGAMQSPGGSVLWNGISTGAKPRNSRSDWWYEDVSTLSLPLYEKVIAAMDARGLRPETIAGALMHYAKKQLPGLSRRQDGRESGNLSIVPVAAPAPVTSAPLSENEQRLLLETIESLLPLQKGVVSTRFLFGLLRIAMILSATDDCRGSLERRIGQQLEQASLDDLLMPNYSYTVETLYDLEAVQRILDHFLMMDQARATSSSIQSFEDAGTGVIGSPQMSPIMMVAKLMDNYLAEVAPDVNLKPAKFQALAETLPEYARLMDDGLYRAIDIYLKAHPWLVEHERERICRIMDCHKLSLEACTHAAQNERLPLRIVVQVLFFEQLQLRTAIAGCFLVADNVDQSRPLRSTTTGAFAAAHHQFGGGMDNIPPSSMGVGHSSLQGGGGWASVIRENQVLKVDMDRMRTRVVELEKECTTMRQEIEKLGSKVTLKSPFGLVTKRFGCRSAKSHVSNSHDKVSSDAAARVPHSAEFKKVEPASKQSQHSRSLSSAH